MKQCKTCKKIKKEEEFYHHPNTKDGLFPECKSCNIARTRKWQKEHPERKKAINRKDWWKHREKRIATLKRNWNNRDFNGLRNVVLKRDNYRCVKCGLTRKEHFQKWGVDINVDHINRKRKDNKLENLQTICLRCHGKKDNGADFLREWRKNHNSIHKG